MTPLSSPRSWFRAFSAFAIIAALAIAQVSCSSRRAAPEDDEAIETSADADSGGEGDFAGELGQPANSGDALSQELAMEELGAPGDRDKNVQPPAQPEPSLSQRPSSTTQAAPAQGNFSGNFSEVAITEIKYLAKKGGGTVVVETSAPATYHTREVPAQSQVILEIANAQLPEKLKRPYVTKDFGQEITSVMAYQDKGSSTVRVVVQFKSPMHANVVQEGRNLMLSSAEAANEIDQDPTLGAMADSDDGLPRSQNGNTQRSAGARTKDIQGSYGDQDTRILPSSSVDDAGFDSAKFYGKPISIEVRNASVRDVINLIAEQSGANIVLSGDVDGQISLKLRQIPWDQALLTVMKTRNLGYVRQGTILRVAPYESLRLETEAARRVLDAQKASEPLRVKIIPVGYAKVDQLEKQVLPFLTRDRGRAVGDLRTNSLVITDTPDVLERIANLVKVLDLPPLQVLIEGKVVEARETFGRDFGVRWGFNGQAVDIGGGRQFLGGFNSNLAVPLEGGVSALKIGQFDIFGNIDAALGLAEKEDLVKIVSSPRVVAVNNEQATITQSIGVPVVTSTVVSGSVVSSVNFQQIEMKLDVTPQVTSENDVIMAINIKREFAGNRVAGQVPDINKREAKSKVLVRNGQTAVVGGVYQSDMNETETGIPWLRSIPVLGWIFKSKSIKNDKSELLVFLTPRILNAETSMQKENNL